MFQPIVDLASGATVCFEAPAPRLRFHDLRHTAGTLLARVVDPVTVEDVLGHADLKTTERYLHAVRASRRADAATRAYTPQFGRVNDEAVALRNGRAAVSQGALLDAQSPTTSANSVARATPGWFSRGMAAEPRARHRALYYPTWGIPDPRFMFEALLYWDRLGCIVPFQGFKPGARWPEELRLVGERLHDEFVSAVVPDERAKEAAHGRIQQVLDVGPPDWCRPESLDPGLATTFGLEKVSHHTLRLLRERGWLAEAPGLDPAAYGTMSSAAACLVLGVLTDELTSESFPRLTNERGLFTKTCNALLCELQTTRGLPDDALSASRAAPIDDAEDRAIVLAKIARLGIRGNQKITAKDLARLADLRAREEFNAQRELFCKHVDRYVHDLRSADPPTRQLVHDDWASQLAQDRSGLKRELRSAGLEAMIDKEGILATGMGLAAGGGLVAVAGPVGIAVGLITGGAGIARSVRQRRAAVFAEHWTSWLFSV